MLSEIILASCKESWRPGLTCSAVYPCPYHIYLTYTEAKEKKSRGKIDPQDFLRMDDGHWQEEQTISRLAKAGVQIENRQSSVYLGKAKIAGHIDGTFELKDKTYLFEHKAMSFEYFTWFNQSGLKKFPGYLAQYQLYLYGLGLTEGVFFVKHKDSCRISDRIIPLDEEFVGNLTSWLDRVVLEAWEPKVEECIYCKECYKKSQCPAGKDVIDFSEIKVLDNKEVADKWKQGKAYSDVGKMLIDEARAEIIPAIGEASLLYVEDLKVQRIVSNRTEFDQEVFVEKYGAINLPEVLKKKEVIQIRISEVKE